MFFYTRLYFFTALVISYFIQAGNTVKIHAHVIFVILLFKLCTLLFKNLVYILTTMLCYQHFIAGFSCQALIADRATQTAVPSKRVIHDFIGKITLIRKGNCTRNPLVVVVINPLIEIQVVILYERRPIHLIYRRGERKNIVVIKQLDKQFFPTDTPR